jgi:hypothetical protein
MKRSDYLIWLGISVAAGTALGMLADRKHPAKGSLLGAAAGVVAGSVAAGIYQYVTSGEKIPYYSKSSPLYDEVSTV